MRNGVKRMAIAERDASGDQQPEHVPPQPSDSETSDDGATPAASPVVGLVP